MLKQNREPVLQINDFGNFIDMRYIFFIDDIELVKPDKLVRHKLSQDFL